MSNPKKDQKMKKINCLNAALVLGAAVLLTLSSCTAETEEVLNPSDQFSGPLAPVKVQISDFSVLIDDQPEAQTRAELSPGIYSEVAAVTLAFYASDGTKMYESTQHKGNAGFGTFSCNLPVGSYTMAVVAYDLMNDDEFTLTSPTVAAFTSAKVRETFAKTQAVTVTGSAALDLEVTLARIVPQLLISSTDPRPVGVSKIRTIYGAGGKSFNPTTGLAIDNAGYSLTNNSSAAIGARVEVKNFVFLATDEQTMDITLEVLDAADEVMVRKVIPNVPLKRNRKTTLSGPLFTPSASSASFVLETSWLDGNTVEF